MTLHGRVALVAGATRGAGRGIAVQLGAAGATVYVTGRTTRSARSEMNRSRDDRGDRGARDRGGPFSLAHELRRPYGATAVALRPGWLRSEAMLEEYGVTEVNWRDALKIQPYFAISETPAFVGRAAAALAADPDVSRWSGQTFSSGELAQVYRLTDVDGSRPDAWRYLVEVVDAGKPADVSGYR